MQRRRIPGAGVCRWGRCSEADCGKRPWVVNRPRQRIHGVLTFCPGRLLLRPFYRLAADYSHHMQQLHAYWRMEYIEAPRYPASMQRPFTDLPQLGDDRAALIIHRSPLSYLILNRFPYNPGHLLAVPFREVTDLEQLNTSERADLFEAVILGQRILRAALKPDGFNIGFNLGSAVAGGSIAHLHSHIVPRWNGDNNIIPVLA